LAKKIIYGLISLILVAYFLHAEVSLSNAQSSPFHVNGKVDANTFVWHSITNIKQGELVLISISGDDLFSSWLTYPNQTVYQSNDFKIMQDYQFIAEVSGTYLLRLNGWMGRNITYSLSSSHQVSISNILTPYRISGSIGLYATEWQHLFGVKEGELILISIKGSDSFNSMIVLPNGTEYQTTVFSKMHSYQFLAAMTGTYLIQLNNWNGRTVNYTISTSHRFSEAAPTEISTQTSYTLIVPEDFPDNKTIFVYDFGDGMTVLTTDRAATHFYGSSDTYTATIKNANDTNNAIIRIVTILIGPLNTKEPGPITLSIILQIVTIIVAIIIGIAGFLYFVINRRDNLRKIPKKRIRNTKTRNQKNIVQQTLKACSTKPAQTKPHCKMQKHPLFF
jgi:hypothetical protein